MFYSQSDERWGDQTYYGNNKFKTSGCFVTSLAMMIDKDPRETASMLRLNGCFTSGGLLVSECASKALRIEYGGKTTRQPNYPCVFETDHFKSSGYPQHFGIIFPNGEIYDPLLNHGPTVNNYHIVSYRLFRKESEEQMDWNLIYEYTVHTIRKARQGLFGHVDEEGATADANNAVGKLKSGNKYELGDNIERYFKGGEFENRWVLKADADVACSKKCATEVAKATKELRKTNDELESELVITITAHAGETKELRSNLAEALGENQELEDKLALNVKTEKIVLESAIINWIKGVMKGLVEWIKGLLK